MAAAARVLTALAAITTVGAGALYLAIIRDQGTQPDTPLVVPLVAGYLGLMAVLLIASLLAPRAAAPAFRGGASAGLLVLGVLSAFSIGAAVLLAAAMAMAATVLAATLSPGARSIVSALLGAVVVVAVLVVGFQVAWSHPACPATGQGGGTLPSLLGPGSSYDCNDGVLTIHS